MKLKKKFNELNSNYKKMLLKQKIEKPNKYKKHFI